MSSMLKCDVRATAAATVAPQHRREYLPSLSEYSPPTIACAHNFVRLETVERRYWIIARSARPLNLKFDENPSSKSSTAPVYQFPFALNFYYYFFFSVFLSRIV